MRASILLSTLTAAVVLTGLLPAFVQAQWIQTHGPYGGSVSAMVLKGTDIFAGVRGVTPATDSYPGGLYRSTDNGTTWAPTALMNRGVGGLAVKGERLFAVSSFLGSSGILMSTDNGTTWADADSGIPSSVYMGSLAAVEGYLFAAGSTVYRSSDSGAFWTPANVGLPNAAVYSFAANGKHLFAGTSVGIYMSTDNGTSWAQASSGLTNIIIFALAVTNDGHLIAATGGGLFSSTDNGTSWASTGSSIPDTNVYSLAVNGPTVFAGVEGSGVYRSTDNGTNWALAGSGLTPLAVRSMLVDGPVIFAGTSGAGIFRSSDNGTNWTGSSSGLPSTEVRSFAVSAAGTGASDLFAATSGGVYRTAESGATWIPTSTGLVDAPTCLAMNGTDLLAGTYGGRLYRLADQDTIWTLASSDLDAHPSQSKVECLAVGPEESMHGYLFAGMEDFGVYLSTDNGASWTQIGLVNTTVRALAIVDTTIIAGTNHGVYRSTDRGSSWSLPSMQDTVVLSLGFNEASLFAGTYWGIFISSDRGTSWMPAKVWSPQQVPVQAFAFSGNSVVAGTNGHGVFLSTNGGSTWAEANSGLGDGLSSFEEARYVQALSLTGPHLLAGTYEGVWRRPLSEMIPTVGPQLVYPPDGMTFFGGPFTFSWNRFAGALLYHLQSSDDSLFQTNLFLNDSTLADTSRWSIPTDSMFSSPYGGGYYWRVRARTTTGWSAWSAPWMYVLSPCEVPESQTVPLEFSLHQSYPNPFNPSTTIRYALPHRTHVMLTVFNTLGQHVATLVNGEVEAGYHEVRFDASGLASGVYFYRLQTGDFVATKRLIVLR